MSMPAPEGSAVHHVALSRQKYRNPENPAETRAGRGLKPRWLMAALKSGKKLEHFVIGTPVKAANTKKMPKRARKAVSK